MYRLKLLIVFLCCGVARGYAQLQPPAYTVPQAVVTNSGNGTETVTYSWGTLPSGTTTVFLLYAPVGSTNWSDASAGGTISPRSCTIPAGNYQFAIGLNSVSNVVTMNGNATGVDNNYVRTFEAVAPVTAVSGLTGVPATTAHQSTDYVDGFGRALETVEMQKSPLGTDMVTPTYYDALGRTSNSYLPFASNNLANSADATSDGSFKTDPFQQQAAFYASSNANSPLSGQGENYFYGQNVYEASPVDRVTKTFAPGNNWVGTMGTGAEKSIQHQYLTNTANDNIYMWTVGSTPGTPIPGTSSLSVSVVVNGSTQTVTYTWSPLPSDASTVLLLYSPLGTPSWTDASAGGTVSPRSANMPTGNYQYAIQVYYSDGTPTVIIPVSPPSSTINLQVAVVNNNNGSQTVTYSWTPLPTGVGTVLLLYSLPGNPNWSDASAGGTNSPRSATVNTGTYQYAIELISSSGNTIVPQSITPPVSTYSTSSTYAAGQLYKHVAIDEGGNQTVTFTDMDGRTIMKRVQAAATVADGYTGWLCTYYIYDDIGNLRLVMPPSATQAYVGGATVASIQDALCYRYEYDSRQRMIVKKDPGKGAVSMVYDARNRLIMMQDANMAALTPTPKWLVTTYDGLNRPLQRGLLTDGNPQAYHADNAYASITYPVTTGSNFELLGQTWYDNYTWMSTTTTGLPSTFDATQISTGFQPASNTVFPYPQTVAPTSYPLRGQTTGALTKQVGSTSTYLYTVNFYDDHNRNIQCHSTNIKGGKTEVTTQYSFNSWILVTKTVANLTSTVQNYTVTDQNTYDAFGRLLTVSRAISGTAPVNGVATAVSSSEQLFTKSYDALGRTQNKTLGVDPITPANPIESLAYDYNIRGWTLGINRKSYVSGASNSNYFGLELAYDKTASMAGGNSYVAARFDGNVAGVLWKTKGAGISRKYDFTYDNADRLATAAFLQNTSGNSWDKTTVDFSVTSMGYDANGNITGLAQNGYLLGKSGAIDQLVYTYPANSNQLTQVTDGANNPSSTLGDFHYTGTKGAYDYKYDANGNLALDNNKGISAIAYDFLNNVQTVTVTGKGSVTYVYDGSGNRLQKITVDNTNAANPLTTTTNYIGLFVFQSQNHTTAQSTDFTDVLQFIIHPEGRVRPAFTAAAGKQFVYDYYVKDQLGDVRMVLTDEVVYNYPYIATFEAGLSSSLTSTYSVSNAANITSYTNIPGGYAANYGPSASGHYQNNNGVAYTADPSVSGTAYSNDMYKLPATTTTTPTTDLGMTLKVAAGDIITILGKSYYFTNGVNPSNTGVINNAVTNLITSFANPAGTLATSTGTVEASTALTDLTTSGNALNTTLLSALNVPAASGSTMPQASINWILFDNQLNAVSTGNMTSGVSVDNNASGICGSLPPQTLTMAKSGYLYVYCSNSSSIDVYFDNLQVLQQTGRILQETHYYPSGLTMAGISDQVLPPGKNNSYRYNGKEQQRKEFSDGTGLEWYDYGARMYDHQIGRWTAPDPGKSPSFNFSPYVYASDNAIRSFDPDGQKDQPFNPATDQPITYIPNTETLTFYYNEKGGYILDPNGRPYLHPGAQNAYNCHSYAWDDMQGRDPTRPLNSWMNSLGITKWDNDPENDIKKTNAVELAPDAANKKGDRVVYFWDVNGNGKWDPGEPIDHSAIVVETDKDGNTTKVIGKLGQTGVAINHPDAPDYYKEHIEYIYDKDGKVIGTRSYKTTRAYFRLPDKGKKTADNDNGQNSDMADSDEGQGSGYSWDQLGPILAGWISQNPNIIVTVID
jgi:RHS repeat-associated protein